MTVLWVIIYLVAGFGAYWIATEEGLFIRSAIVEKFGDQSDDVYTDFYRKTQFIPKSGTFKLNMALAIVIGFSVWFLWPLFAIGGGIYSWYMYKRIDKVWSKKLELE